MFDWEDKNGDALEQSTETTEPVPSPRTINWNEHHPEVYVVSSVIVCIQNVCNLSDV